MYGASPTFQSQSRLHICSNVVRRCVNSSLLLSPLSFPLSSLMSSPLVSLRFAPQSLPRMSWMVVMAMGLVASGGWAPGGSRVQAQAAAGADAAILAPPDQQRRQQRSDSELIRLRPVPRSVVRPAASAIRPELSAPAGLLPGVKQGLVQQGYAEPLPPSVGSRASGSFGIPFTSGRVQSGPSSVSPSAQSYLSSTYPYRAVGRLNFDQGYCSASLIRRGVIVTAAHCVQDFGSGTSIFSGFEFVPAFWSNGTSISRPYGTYRWAGLVRPSSWANGRDTGSGVAKNNDVAVIALAPVGGVFAGDRAGYLGYAWNNYSFVRSSRTGNRFTAEINTLGYPYLLDRGLVMQMTTGPSSLVTVGGALNIEQGSSFTGGSSGGPWVANFNFAYPAYAGGASPGATANRLAVVGVTSWGAADPNTPKDNFSSQFRQNAQYPRAAYGTYGGGNIGSLLNTLCAARPVGSALTFAQLGYCR